MLNVCCAIAGLAAIDEPPHITSVMLIEAFVFQYL